MAKMNMLLECVIIISLFVTVLSENCQFPSQSGSADFVQKQLQRLDSLRNKTFSTNYDVAGKILTFKFRLCGMPSSVVCLVLPNATALVEDGGTCLGSIGTYSNTFISSGSNWVSMTFSDGKKTELSNANVSLPQTTTVTFICDSNTKENFALSYTNQDKVQEQVHYLFILNTDQLCDKPPVGGLSSGSIFCIIFFTVTGVYFLFGFLYRRFVVRAKGVEQIPNYDVWKEFGNLVADGCDYMCRCGTRQESKMYQGIGDPLGIEESESEERDDRLLPM